MGFREEEKSRKTPTNAIGKTINLEFILQVRLIRGLDRISNLPDIRSDIGYPSKYLSGYPAGCWISNQIISQISGQTDNQLFGR